MSPADYLHQVEELEFNVGDTRVCHRVIIIDDNLCERNSENFLSSLSDASGSFIVFDFVVTEITIEDEMEPECGQFLIKYVHSLLQLSVQRSNSN